MHCFTWIYIYIYIYIYIMELCPASALRQRTSQSRSINICSIFLSMLLSIFLCVHILKARQDGFHKTKGGPELFSCLLTSSCLYQDRSTLPQRTSGEGRDRNLRVHSPRNRRQRMLALTRNCPSLSFPPFDLPVPSMLNSRNSGRTFSIRESL